MSIFTDRETAAIQAGLKALLSVSFGMDSIFIPYSEWQAVLKVGSANGSLELLRRTEINVLYDRIGDGNLESIFLDPICDELAGITMNHIIDGVVLTENGIKLEVRDWDEPYIIPLRGENNSG